MTNRLIAMLAIALWLSGIEAAHAQQNDDWRASISRHARLMGQGKYTEALPEIERAKQLAEAFDAGDLRRTETQVHFATTLDYLGRYPEAEKIYRELLALPPLQLPKSVKRPYLLRSIGRILVVKALFMDAEKFYTEALKIESASLAKDDPARAEGLSAMADLFLSQGRHKDARPYAEEAMALVSRTKGPMSLEMLGPLNSLAWAHNGLREFEKSQPLFEQTISILERRFGPEHARLAYALNNLAAVHLMKGSYAEAATLFRRVLRINEKAMGSSNPEIASNLNDLALALRNTASDEEVELLYLRSLEITEKAYGLSSPRVTTPLINLAGHYMHQGKDAQAEKLLRRVVQIQEDSPQLKGTVHPIGGLNNLASLLIKLKRTKEAEPLVRRAFEMAEKLNGPVDPMLAMQVSTVAELYSELGQFEAALPAAERAFAITQTVPGPSTSEHANSALTLAEVSSKTGHSERAEEMYKLAIRNFDLRGLADGRAVARHKYAEHLDRVGRSAEAKSLRSEADAIVAPKKK